MLQSHIPALSISSDSPLRWNPVSVYKECSSMKAGPSRMPESQQEWIQLHHATQSQLPSHLYHGPL